jgi:hypothetical protein
MWRPDGLCSGGRSESVCVDACNAKHFRAMGHRDGLRSGGRSESVCVDACNAKHFRGHGTTETACVSWRAEWGMCVAREMKTISNSQPWGGKAFSPAVFGHLGDVPIVSGSIVAMAAESTTTTTAAALVTIGGSRLFCQSGLSAAKEAEARAPVWRGCYWITGGRA